MSHPIAHTPPTVSELLGILTLFPKCMTCGAVMHLADRLEPDPTHAFRLRHAGPCTSPMAA